MRVVFIFVVLLVLLALATVGVGLCVSGRRALYWQMPLLAGVGILVFHTLTITSARFRLPIEALMLLPAAVASAVLAEALGRFGSRPLSCLARVLAR